MNALDGMNIWGIKGAKGGGVPDKEEVKMKEISALIRVGKS